MAVLIRSLLALLLVGAGLGNLSGKCPYEEAQKIARMPSCCTHDDDASAHKEQRSCCDDQRQECRCFPALVLFAAEPPAVEAVALPATPVPVYTENLHELPQPPPFHPPRA